MNDIENEPAFPAYDHLEQLLTDGMSLRDYFAAKAMQGMFSNSELTTVINSHDQFAELSYRMADAMLRAREHDTR